MAIQYIGYSRGRNVANLSHAVSATTDFLIVSVAVRLGTVASVKYNNTALTSAGGVNWFGNWHSSIWYMVSPPVGTANVTIDKSSEVKISAMNFSGVDPSTPYRTNYPANGNAPSSVSISVSVVAGDLMIDSLLLTNQITWTPSSGQTQINQYSTSSLPCVHGNSYKIASSTGSVGMGWSGSKLTNEMTYLTSVFIPAPDKRQQIIIV